MTKLEMRPAVAQDVKLYFDWANDGLVRKQSFYSNEIDFESHKDWFQNKLRSSSVYLLVFELESRPVGQVRLEIGETSTVIGISIDSQFRGKGLGYQMLDMACNHYFKGFRLPIHAFIKKENVGSIRAFEKANFEYLEEDKVNNVVCNKYIRVK